LCCYCSECYLREIQGANWDAGIIVASNVDAQECACLCVNYTRPCSGVDYSVDDRSCFLHLRTAQPLGIQPASCCVRYDYSCDSESSLVILRRALHRCPIRIEISRQLQHIIASVSVTEISTITTAELSGIVAAANIFRGQRWYRWIGRCRVPTGTIPLYFVTVWLQFPMKILTYNQRV